jgi:hypothetical protein
MEKPVAECFERSEKRIEAIETQASIHHLSVATQPPLVMEKPVVE